jgi:hypothetical protein
VARTHRIVGAMVPTLAAVALLAVPGQGHAQTRNHLLRGISNVALVIEDLSANDKGCGLTEEAIRAAVMYPLSSTQIEVKPSSDVTLYVNTTSLSFPAASVCVTNLSVEVYTYQNVMLKFSGYENRVQIDLWHSGYIASSDTLGGEVGMRDG